MTQILIVDDDDNLRGSLADLLAEAGYATTEARNGQEALKLIAEGSGGKTFDVLLSDIKMPGVDGLALLHHVRTTYPDLAVIMLTGYGTVDSAVQALREGAVNYLLKPTSKRQLLEALREAIEWRASRHQRQQLVDQVVSSLQALGMVDPNLEATLNRSFQTVTPTPVEDRFLRVGELIIDQHRLMAIYQDNPLELTPTEFEILYCLMQAAGRVVTFEDIAFRLQGIRLERDEARTLLSTHLSNLRGKLRVAGCEDYVKNSRGSGYFIDA